MQLDHTYATAVPELSVPWRAADFPEPQLVALNEPLARELGLDPDRLRTSEGIALLTGATDAPAFAQAYAGHQFGQFSPRLGDGRALLLGELTTPAGNRVDLHLKGSGPTPFSRGGDGFAALGPMLREFLIGEALHGRAIPTSRALAVVTTGAMIQREALLPGAVLVRVAPSHLRVGTFEYAATTTDRDTLGRLTAYALTRHFPTAEPTALSLLREVEGAHARLVAQWQCAGFVHGVMNTDNHTIGGFSIDFGPCAFLDTHDERAVFSSIDRQGRYAFGNQPAISQWNLARLAESLLPLIDDDPDRAVAAALEVLLDFATEFRRAYATGLAAKLDRPEVDPAQIEAELAGHDHTTFFTPRPGVNPRAIARNHRVEEILAAAVAGNMAPFETAVADLRDPYCEPCDTALATPPPADAPRHITFCGT